MKTGTLLDADMTTLGRQFSGATTWWLQELAAMRPNWARKKTTKISGVVVVYDVDGALRLQGALSPIPADHGGRTVRAATILFPEALCLIRNLTLPAMRRADLRKLVTLDLDRLMPFPQDTAYADAAETGVQAADGKAEVAIAALPKAKIRAIHAQALEAGLSPRAIGIADEAGGALRFDFLPALAAEGIATKTASGARFWWGLVAALFALNIAALIFRDVERVSRLAALVDLQQPSAIAARQLGKRIADDNAIRAELLARREQDNALAALALVTRTIPNGVWIQRYGWTGETLRLAGYKQANVDVVAALRKNGAFASVRASSSDIAAESATGQPFDIAAEWQRSDSKR